MKTIAIGVESPNQNPMAVVRFGPVPQWIEEAITNRPVVGSNPTRPATLISPASRWNYQQSLSLGLAPETEFTRLTVIVRPFPKKRKAINDMPQLPPRYGEGWFLRKDETGSALEAPALRKAIR